MLVNYLKIALRNILRSKVFSFINIIGLSVGIACFVALFLFIKDELSYDKFNKKAEQIYRVYTKMVINGKESINSKTGAPLGSTLIHDFPEVQTFTRIGYFGSHVFRYNDKVFREWSIYTADSTFFDVFSLNFIAGNPKTALDRPNTIVMTESAAKKYFGNENPVGKSFTEEQNGSFLITGLIKDFPENSHFSCDILMSMSTYPITRSQYWLDLWYTTYIVLKKGTDPKAFENKMKNVVINYVGPQAEKILGIPIKEFMNKGNNYEFLIQPLKSIYLESRRNYGIDPNTEWGDVKSSDIAYVYVFSAVAICILFVAIINFMNLSTARSEKRSKEVGIRKTLGSNKLKLIWQFIIESVLMCSFSVILAMGLLEVIIPLFNKLVDKNLKMDYLSNPLTIPALIVFMVIVGILAGSYPAFYLSSFQPVQILKSSGGKGNRKSLLRSTLVVIQFAVSITLLIGTIIIKNQLGFIQSKNLGFNKEHIVTIKNVSILGDKIEPFKQELLKTPGITSVSLSSFMFRSGIPGSAYLFDRKTGADPVQFQEVDADYDFLNTFQIKIKEGRFFSKEFPSDSAAVLINEAAIRELGAHNPLEKELNRLGNPEWAKTFKIIGVIKDFNYESLHQQIRPLIIHLDKPHQAGFGLNIRVRTENIKNSLNTIENNWRKFAGRENIYYGFVDEDIAHLYDSEKKTSLVAALFSFLAISIACLGLFGLAAFITEQRTKEIGIRKALGASVLEIVYILSKEFTKWVIVANIIAWPVAYLVMNSWLKNFAYKVELSIWIFVISGVTALAIALITIGTHAIKAATANPIKSLKYE
jgi:putative ABC transport system permease protein